jgi:predicted O-methyltransferase YrrM
MSTGPQGGTRSGGTGGSGTERDTDRDRGRTAGGRPATNRPSAAAAGVPTTDPAAPRGTDQPFPGTDQRPPGQPGQLYAETFRAEDPAAAAARARAAEVGVVPVSPGVATTLTFLAATVGAGAAVEIGTGTGVSALALVAGLRSGGILTSVDVEGEHHRLARTAMTEAGIAPTRARLINGRALDVLPRLTDGAYDIVFADADAAENEDYLSEALRLLRRGGIVAFNAALADSVADPTRRDAATEPALHATVRDHERLSSVLLPVGSGLLVASVTS